MTALESCYSRLAQIAEGKIDSLAVVAQVEEYRRYWMPQNVRVILLAESHVATTDDEMSCQLDAGLIPLQSYPTDYVRFVYCLGYGENNLLQSPMHGNRGTPQFWQIFFSCCNRISSNDDFSPILKTKTTNMAERIENKCRLLSRLKRKGVWLVDASIVGIYSPGGGRLSPKKVRSIIRRSWDLYVRDVVAEAKPSYLICIGTKAYTMS